MKNALYKYINADIAYIHEVFLHYGYPNIADESVREFCEVLIGWIEEIEAENEADDFALESVRQLLKSARKKKNLCFPFSPCPPVGVQLYHYERKQGTTTYWAAVDEQRRLYHYERKQGTTTF